MRTLNDRPVLLERYPNGVRGKSFFQKRIPESAPDWLQTTTVETINGTPSRALVIADLKVENFCVTPERPSAVWHLSRKIPLFF